MHCLDLLSTCRIVFLRKSSDSLDILTEAKLVARFRPAERSLIGLYGGYYVAELLNGLTEQYDPHPVLFQDALSTLEQLAADEQTSLAIIRFELAVLREIGQLPAFDCCTVCERPAPGQGPYSFWVSQGGLICRACRTEKYARHPVQGGTVAVLQALSSPGSAVGHRIGVSPAQLKELRTLLSSAVSHVMGRRPKMLPYLETNPAKS